jgi:asparagine synthase (glutamine-hydrolysing)
MSGLCGWFGRGQMADSAGTLEQMAHALPNHGLIQTKAASGPNFGLALCTHPASGAFVAEPSIVAAIEGYPEWSDHALDALAKTHGHASALVEGYKRKGRALFEVLHGAFALAILDLSAKKALFAIDRFGIQTMCYAQPGPNLIVFGSTTDAVRAHPDVGATISMQSIFDYFYLVDRIPAPSTIYREQRKLVPAEFVLVEPDKTIVTTYWQMPYQSDNRVSKATATEKLKERLNHAVKTSLMGEADGKIGAFLSGGLDSSSVVGIAAHLLSRNLLTFTIGFPIDGFDESQYAEIVAQHFGTKHQTHYVRPHDVIDILLKSVEIYDEPFGNSSFIPAYVCACLAKEAGVEMMLAGDGGDELFAGNKRYAEDAIFDYYAMLPSAIRNSLVEPLAAHLSFAKNAGPLGKALRYVERAKKSVTERLADNVFLAVDPIEMFSENALREIDTKEPIALMADIFRAPLDASKVQRMMNLDLRVTLADSDLRKVARMCELAGVRVRFPFLNDDLAELSAQLPETLLMEGGKLRQFYKDAMRGFLPEAVITKQKHGFGLPYTAYMNSHAPLRELICDCLEGLKREGYFRPEFLDQLKDRANTGTLSGHETIAWDLAVIGLWLNARK